MNLNDRIELLLKLGEYLKSGNEEWKQAKERASQENPWFIEEFINNAVNAISDNYLNKTILNRWISPYRIPEKRNQPATIGVVMAGNIPMAGFHDLMSVFISGHKAMIKPSSKDAALIKHVADKILAWSQDQELIQFASMLKGCDGYIATGSNNTSRYFDYYFNKYPHIIRRSRTSVALLTGDESSADLEKLADDVYVYFGMGCRNVTKIYVPKNYDFVPLLDAFRKYDYLEEHNRYKNNYDYNLAIQILNKQYYMTNGSVLLVESQNLFSPISQLNYEFYEDRPQVMKRLENHPDLQAIIGSGFIPFGQAQQPEITDYADGEDTLKFLNNFTTEKNYEELSK